MTRCASYPRHEWRGFTARLGKPFLLATGIDPDSNGLHLSIGPVGQADVEQSTVKPSDGPA